MARTLELTHIQYPSANNTNIELGSDTVTFSSNIAVAVNNGTIQGVTLTGSNITIGAGKSIDTQNGAIFTSAAQKKTIIENAASNLDIGNYKLTAQQLKADITTGTAPLEITSTTMVSNLNVNYVGGFTAANLFNVGHSSVSGILGIDHGGTGSATTNANRVFIGPSSGNAAAPSFRILAAADLPAYVAPGAGSSDSVAGKVPAATGTATANAGKFLKVDGTWEVPPDTIYESSDFDHDALDGFVGNEHIDWSVSQSGNSPDVIHADNYTDTTYNAMGAGNAYATGLVPTGASDHVNKYLRQDGSWDVPLNNQYSSSDFDHDALDNFVGKEHIDWTADQSGTYTFHASNYTDTQYDIMGSGNNYDAGITPAGSSSHGNTYLRKDGTWGTPLNDQYSSSDFDHDSLNNYVGDEHIDWTADQSATHTFHANNYTDTQYDIMGSGNGYAAGLTPIGHATHGDTYLRKDGTWATPLNTEYASGDFDHDALTNFLLKEHIDWTIDQSASYTFHAGNYTDTVTSVGISGDLSTGNVTLEGTGTTSVTKSSGTVTIDTPRGGGIIGEIRMWGGSAVPDSTWHFCDGSVLTKNGYPDLYAILKGGTQTCRYGEDTTHFYLPDLRGRVPLGAGTGRGGTHSGTGGSTTNSDSSLTTRNLGSYDGREEVTLSEAELASHDHTVNKGDHTHGPGTLSTDTQSASHKHNFPGDDLLNRMSNADWSETTPVSAPNDVYDAQSYTTGDGKIWRTSAQDTSHTHDVDDGATGGASTYTITTEDAGSDDGHNNIQPFMCINFIIKIS